MSHPTVCSQSHWTQSCSDQPVLCQRQQSGAKTYQDPKEGFKPPLDRAADTHALLDDVHYGAHCFEGSTNTVFELETLAAETVLLLTGLMMASRKPSQPALTAFLTTSMMTLTAL